MTSPRDDWTARLGLSHPIIQAPMAGGATTPELVAAVAHAGGLGFLAAGLLDAPAIARAIADIRALTDRPFGINLFVLPSPFPAPDAAEVQRALQWLAPRYAALDLPLPDVGAPGWRWCEDFRSQLDAVAAAAPAAVSFTFGIVGRDVVERLHAAGTQVIGTATTVDEALAWQAVGADAVVAQGYEAGAHRGTFLGDAEHSLIGTLPLVRACTRALRIPVIAAGGIMDGAGIAAALALGAAAAQMGTAFLVCDECRIPAAHRAALLAACGAQAASAADSSSAPPSDLPSYASRPWHTPTRITRLFSGRHARGIVNRYMEDLRHLEAEVPSYPVLNALTGPLRKAAAAAGDAQQLSLWAGQGVEQARPMPASQLVKVLADELAREQAPGALPRN